MAENKTKATSKSVGKFIKSVEDEKKREDSIVILEMLKEITGEPPVMWGNSLVGFGKYHYKYDSGREGDMFIAGFSPRKQNMTVYIMPGFERFDDLMKKLGKYKTGKACLYFKHLEDIDINVFEKLLQQSVSYMKNKYCK